MRYFSLLFFFLCGVAFASPVVVTNRLPNINVESVTYEEVTDCEYPSTRERVCDENKHCYEIVKQDDRCT